MYHRMAKTQETYHLSERLIRTISDWQSLTDSGDKIEDLLEAGADVNHCHGTLLPLGCASMVSDAYCVELLIENGANVNAIDGYGRAPLHYAAERDPVCTELLLASGAHVNIRDANQDTPLHWAAFKDKVSCVEILCLNGADTDALDYGLDTPLSWAAMKGNLDTMKILLEYNADVTTLNYNGRTPLVRSASIQASGLNNEYDDECLHLLIKANGQFQVRNENNQVPREISQDNKLCELLLPLSDNPRSLHEQCRFNIRKSMGKRYLPNAVRQLPVPDTMQNYILLR
ncbi:unnamed protein product [Owenia fusiformis]|uniref:Uncharacterized protein n=1 Tax=Owenia fusiformis TaxID=6347 RepID=A0A8J1UFT9_OWEFU|nr:unnamed protein product [Owenia fusiformis]